MSQQQQHSLQLSAVRSQDEPERHKEPLEEATKQRPDRQDFHSSREQASCSTEDARKQLEPQQYSPFQDVRMKRHPELQPYVPSDRYTRIVPKTSSSSMTTAAPGLPKKYCSMSRLNQLAQPKNKKATRDSSQDLHQRPKAQQVPRPQPKLQPRPPPPPSSSARALPPRSQSRPIKTQQSQGPRPQQEQLKQSQGQKLTQQPHRLQQPPQQQQLRRLSDKPQQSQQQRRLSDKPKHLDQQPQRRQSDKPQPITPIAAAGANKPTTLITPMTPASILPAHTPHSSTPVTCTPKDTLSTPNVQLPTPASSLEEELESANRTRDIVSMVSEMSVNDPFYQSAASELVPDSEKSIGNDFEIQSESRDAESLCREFEQDLIAKGIIKNDSTNDFEDEFRSLMSNGKDDSMRRTSAATIVTSDSATRPSESSQAHDEDDRRLRIEKELREKAKKEDDDRKRREQLVESILSRVSQGSVS